MLGNLVFFDAPGFANEGPDHDFAFGADLLGHFRVADAVFEFFHVDGAGDTLELARSLVEKSNVGLAPGNAFGPGGDGYLRLCFASSEETLSEAMDRLRPHLS